MHRLCINCKRFFETKDENARMCIRCHEEYMRNRIICREYLEQHRGASLAEVSRATRLPIRKVRQLIEDGFIEYRH